LDIKGRNDTLLVLVKGVELIVNGFDQESQVFVPDFTSFLFFYHVSEDAGQEPLSHLRSLPYPQSSLRYIKTYFTVIFRLLKHQDWPELLMQSPEYFLGSVDDS
jgi:hypothetical protein